MISLSVLVHREQQVKVFAEKGVEPVYFKDLDAVDRIREVAADYDGLSATSTNTYLVR